ncbi:mitochondrial carrier domain-containing protein [Phakopsora pachyrhizi]|uniref:Mitochondrial carrier domain-containing protein n=1 Tax=Phakopsora pachyrhizi TaxID=170000 RepID=A0AAV0BPV7_PHAPC|nr:mitochondrial carrier domain-containing protein [Phakopsora pachyrhizi]CAH7689375.1 mitochondrial carrier domain-containing protein [Phakopsora pachyrhizi]
MNSKNPSNLTPSIPSASSTTTATTATSTASSTASTANQSNGSKAGSHLVEYFLAGGAAGAVSRTVVSPLERLKIIFQCQGPGSANYQGMWSSLLKIGREEGWRGYFRGNGINVIRIAPYSAIQFSSYEVSKKLLSKISPTGDLTTPLRLSAGAIAGICSVVSTYPLDLVRSRLSIISASIGDRAPTKSGRELSMMGMALQVYRTEGGLRALYRGLVPTVVGVAPYVGSNFAAYELLKQYFCPPDQKKSFGVIRKLACGALAGAMSQSLTYPLDVLRRRMQVTGMSGIKFKYDGAWHATKSIFRNEGIRGLYKGLWPNLCKVAPSIGTSFVTYELVRDYLLKTP